MPDIAFVNGRFLPLADAKVSIEDRGFQFGDGIYEVIRTYGGRPFDWRPISPAWTAAPRPLISAALFPSPVGAIHS